MSILERLGVEKPIIQAGMGPAISRHRLAAAVSEAGGLGTIAVQGQEAIEREIKAARSLTSKPIALNVILHYARSSWFRAAEEADAVVTFWGVPRRRTSGVWIHQAGSVREARAAQAAGADAVMVQGVEAGGHVRGTVPALELLEQTRNAVGADYPLFLAGGIAEVVDVEQALTAGATAAVAGTRFLLSDESDAHPAYKAKALASQHTILTELFGLSWAAPHRVVANAATALQLGPDGGVPLVNQMINHGSSLGARYAPRGLTKRMLARQRPGSRALLPYTPDDRTPAGYVEAGPLYAGATVSRISSLMPAAAIVAALTP